MNYEEFAADLSLHETIVFESVEENEEAMKCYGVNQEMRQLGRGKYRAEMAVRSTEQLQLFSDRFSTAISLCLEPPDGNVGFLFPRIASGQFLASGTNVSNGMLIVLPPGIQADIVSTGLMGSDAFVVPEKRFIELAEVLCPTSVPMERMTLLSRNTHELRALRQTVVELVAHPELKPQPEHLSNLLAATVAWVGDASNSRHPENVTGNGARARVAKRAQEFVEEHYQEAVHIEDLCCLTKVGVRTLQRCFKEYFGLTITNYLKMVRLNAAYRELNSANAIESSVTQIALEHGFTHFGRFSVAIREQFGESPTDTLRRRRDRKWFPAYLSASR